MTVLAIDTSSRRRVTCLVATAEGELGPAAVSEDADIDRVLPPLLQALLDASVSVVVVVVGPGSYTGVRTGMAAALGVAHARGLPLHGVTSLDTVAAGARAGGAIGGWALVDAGRQGAYAARFDAASVAAWSRIDLGAFDAGDVPAYGSEPLPVPGLRLIDPATALARAVPLALDRAPLRFDDLRALYDGPA
jgi:tRNA threonylcarbamoyladenosine biosynthesis protein TsaB